MTLLCSTLLWRLHKILERAVSLLRGRAKAKADAVKLAVEGFAMSNEQKIRVNVIQQHFTMIDRLIATLDQEINRLIVPYEPQLF